MTEGTGRSTNRSPAAAVAFAVAALVAAACDSTTICNCPSGGGVTTVAVPAARSSPITSVSADQPCSASVNATGDVVLYDAVAGTCHVVVRLANGDGYAFSV